MPGLIEIAGLAIHATPDCRNSLQRPSTKVGKDSELIILGHTKNQHMDRFINIVRILTTFHFSIIYRPREKCSVLDWPHAHHG